MQNVRTFDYYRTRALPTFAEVLNWNAMMKAPAAEYLKKNRRKRAIDVPEFAELWDALMRPVDPEVTRHRHPVGRGKHHAIAVRAGGARRRRHGGGVCVVCGCLEVVWRA